MHHLAAIQPASQLPGDLLAILAFDFLLVSLKTLAVVTGLVLQMSQGGAVAVALRNNQADARARLSRLIYGSNPMDRWLYREGGGVARRRLALVFWAPGTTTLGAVGLIVADADTQGGVFHGLLAVFIVVLAIMMGVSTTVSLVTAVVRRLIFGAYLSRTVDAEPARRFRLTSKWSADSPPQWAVFVDEGSNLPFVFLGLVYLAVIGFAGLYAGLDAVFAGAFAPQRLALTPFSSVYLSVSAVSTVGFGDVHAGRGLTELAATWQIATGPLLLSWLLAVFLTPGSGGAPQRDLSNVPVRDHRYKRPVDRAPDEPADARREGDE